MLYFIMDETGPDGANRGSMVRTIKYQPAGWFNELQPGTQAIWHSSAKTFIR